MSKTPVDWTFQEVVASAKLDQMTLDEMRKGQLIISSAGAYAVDATGPPTMPVLGTVYLGYYPYSPAKQTYNRMRIIGSVQSTVATVEVRYNLASGVGGWTHATLAEAFTPPIVPTLGAPATGPGMTTVDLSGIVGFEWLGLRLEFSGATANPVTYSWTVFAFLYNATDTPF